MLCRSALVCPPGLQKNMIRRQRGTDPVNLDARGSLYQIKRTHKLCSFAASLLCQATLWPLVAVGPGQWEGAFLASCLGVWDQTSRVRSQRLPSSAARQAFFVGCLGGGVYVGAFTLIAQAGLRQRSCCVPACHVDRQSFLPCRSSLRHSWSLHCPRHRWLTPSA